jgi:hypothetical protein
LQVECNLRSHKITLQAHLKPNPIKVLGVRFSKAAATGNLRSRVAAQKAQLAAWYKDAGLSTGLRSEAPNRTD